MPSQEKTAATPNQELSLEEMDKVAGGMVHLATVKVNTLNPDGPPIMPGVARIAPEGPPIMPTLPPIRSRT